MPEIAELLKDAAADPTRRPPLDQIQHRARRRRQARGAATAAALGVVVLLAGLVVFSRPGADDAESIEYVGVPEEDEVTAMAWGDLAALLPPEPVGASVSWRTIPGDSGDGDWAAAALDARRLGASTPEDLRSFYGIDPLSLSVAVIDGIPWSTGYTVVSGSIDPDAVDAAIRADAARHGRLEMKSYGGYEYYSWGDGTIYTEGADQASGGSDGASIGPESFGMRLFVRPGLALWAGDDETVDGFIDRLGAEPDTRLASHVALAATAERLEIDVLDVTGSSVEDGRSLTGLGIVHDDAGMVERGLLLVAFPPEVELPDPADFEAELRSLTNPISGASMDDPRNLLGVGVDGRVLHAEMSPAGHSILTMAAFVPPDAVDQD